MQSQSRARALPRGRITVTRVRFFASSSRVRDSAAPSCTTRDFVVHDASAHEHESTSTSTRARTASKRRRGENLVLRCAGPFKTSDVPRFYSSCVLTLILAKILHKSGSFSQHGTFVYLNISCSPAAACADAAGLTGIKRCSMYGVNACACDFAALWPCRDFDGWTLTWQLHMNRRGVCSCHDRLPSGPGKFA